MRLKITTSIKSKAHGYVWLVLECPQIKSVKHATDTLIEDGILYGNQLDTELHDSKRVIVRRIPKAVGLELIGTISELDIPYYEMDTKAVSR